MITEWRKLTFSMDELSAAILSYLQSTRGMAKGSRIGGIVIKAPESGTLEVTIYQEPGAAAEIELKPEAVAALMVAHCIRTGTPLPKRARKSIAVDGDRLSLVLIIGGANLR